MEANLRPRLRSSSFNLFILSLHAEELNRRKEFETSLKEKSEEPGWQSCYFLSCYIFNMKNGKLLEDEPHNFYFLFRN